MRVGPRAEHSASVLSQDSAFGDVLHSFFGYSDAPHAAATAELRRLPGHRRGGLPRCPRQARGARRTPARHRL